MAKAKSILPFLRTAEQIYLGEILDHILANYESMQKNIKSIINPGAEKTENLNNLVKYLSKMKNVEVIINDELDKSIVKYKSKKKKRLQPVGEFVDFLKRLRKFSKAEVYDLSERNWEDLIIEKIELLKPEIEEIVIVDSIETLDKYSKLGNSMQLVIFIETNDVEDAKRKIDFITSIAEELIVTLDLVKFSEVYENDKCKI